MTLHLGSRTALRRVDPALRVRGGDSERPTTHGPDDIVVGPNPRMRAIFEYLERVGPGTGSVLVTGESGTGKEVVAHAAAPAQPAAPHARSWR